MGSIYPGGKHCVITWNGCYQNGIVTVLDESLNGTFINGVKIVKGHTVVLRHGNEISFHAPATQTRGHEDYRFIYRHVVNPPKTSFENKYDILTDLGRGSYGVVKKAVCRATGEYVAVKILKDAKTFRSNNSHPQSHYFRREIEVLQMLKHENICELKEAFFWENGSDEICTCLVLELVEGGDFLAYLLQHAPLSALGDEQQDLRTRVLERTIDWIPLDNENPSPEAIEFIRLLLDVNPQHRMTLTNALNHAWFATYKPVYDRKAKVNSRNFISAVQGNTTYSRRDRSRHTGSFVAPDDSELQVSATYNLGITSKTFNEHVQVLPMRSPREVYQHDVPSSGSDEYPPGLLKSAH
ncbi:hypothetical protein C0993_009115 [Termitomyces sp. T159_Od127]|nr:hypothetical protein C0993_009115 [Termitomyces sp. T159_Od127]